MNARNLTPVEAAIVRVVAIIAIVIITLANDVSGYHAIDLYSVILITSIAVGGRIVDALLK